MERIQSLINKLSVQSRADASLAELLETTELLRNELMAETRQNDLNVVNAVAVWLPSGYTKKPAPAVAVENSAETVTSTEPEEVIVKEINPVQQAPRVPMPPSRIIASPEVEPAVSRVSELAQQTSPQSDFFPLDMEDEELEAELPSRLNRSYPLSGKSAEISTQAYQPRVIEKNRPAQETTVEVKEIETNTIKPQSTSKSNIPFPDYPADASELMKNIFPLAAPPVVSVNGKEVNELVADPGVPLYERLQQKKVELGDVLVDESRIADLRKAFSINDKYQVIHDLFRNDEDMFERSVRTINNFGSLPEARFWMQRELALKLGWNDNDEKVKHFYRLVTRRFA